MSRRASFDDTLWDLAMTEDAPSSLLDLRPLLTANPGVPLTVETVIVDAGDPVEALATSGDEVKRLGVVSALRLRDERGTFIVSLWPAGPDNVFHLVATVPSTDSRWRGIERRIGAASATVVPFFLDHDDYSAIATTLSEHGDVEVSRMTARDRTDLSSLSKGWPSRKGAARPSPEDVLTFVEESGAAVRTMTLHVSETLAIHLRRRAGATYYSGDLNLFVHLVLARLAAAGEKRRTLLTDRARQVGHAIPRPLTIRLPDPLFKDAEATGQLIEEVQKQRDLSVAVMHRNPYLHIVVTDYLDGSNFDVFITNEDAIDVHPGFRATVGALGRLTRILSERFLALDVAERPPVGRLSLDDLASNG